MSLSCWQARREADALAFTLPMPKLWIYTQVLIVVFVVIGFVIAIIRLS